MQTQNVSDILTVLTVPNTPSYLSTQASQTISNIPTVLTSTYNSSHLSMQATQNMSNVPYTQSLPDERLT